MTGHTTYRRVRGTIGNAVLWGAGWTALGLTALGVLRLVGAAPELTLIEGLALAAKFGIIGVVTGTAFSAAVGMLYRRQRLQEISCTRFGLGGAVLAGLFVPTFFQAMNVLSGDGMVPMQYVLDDSVWATVFGGVAAAGSLKLAQRAASATTTSSPPERTDAHTMSQLLSPHITSPVDRSRERDAVGLHTH